MSEKERSKQPKSHRLRKGIAAATLLGTAMASAGCDVSAEKVPHPKYIAVPDQGSNLTSPTDEAANRIAATNYAEVQLEDDKSFAKGFDPAEVIDLPALDAASTAKAVEDEIIDPVRFGESYTKKSVKEDLETLAQIEDPTVRRLAIDAYSGNIISSVLYDTWFDDVEPPTGHAIIDDLALPKKDAAKLHVATDAMDARSAVFDGPTAIGREAKDVADPAIKQAMLEAAKFPLHSPEYNAIASTLYDQATPYEKLAKQYEKAGEAAYDKLDAIAYESTGDTVTEYVADFNNMTPPHGRMNIEPPTDPTKRIDLSGVDGTKQVYEPFYFEDHVVFHQFGEVYTEGNEVTIRFEDDSDVSKESQAQIKDIVERANPLLRSAFASGNLLAVRLVVSDMYDPHYDPTTHEIVMKLSTNDPLSEDQLFSGLVHETVHALMGDESYVSKEEIAGIRTACNQLSKSAYDDAELYLGTVSSTISKLAASANPQDKKFFEQLQHYIDSKDIDTLMREKAYSPDALYDTNCTPYTFGDLVYNVAKKAKIKHGDNYVSDFLARYDDNADFREVVGTWHDAIEEYSLYELLSESTYVQTDSESKQYLGHPRDNADELIASVVTAVICYNEPLKHAYDNGIGGSDKTAAKNAITATARLIANRHPELKIYLHNQVAAIIE